MKKKLFISVAVILAAVLLGFLLCLKTWHITGVSTSAEIILLREDDNQNTYSLADDIIYTGNPSTFWKSILPTLYGMTYTCDDVQIASDGVIRASDITQSDVSISVHIASTTPILNSISADTSFTVYSVMPENEAEETEKETTSETAQSDSNGFAGVATLNNPAGATDEASQSDPEGTADKEPQLNPDGYVGIIGHSGYSAKYAANSKDAFEQGAKAGMAGLECDLNISDGELVCYHVGEEDTDVCSFADYLDICEKYGCIGIADLQSFESDCYIGACETILEKKLQDQIVIQSDDDYLLGILSRKYSGEIKLWYLCRNTVTSDDISTAAGISGVVGINANAWMVEDDVTVADEANRSEETIKAVHDAGLAYCVYSLDAEDSRTQVKNAGIDYIMSNTY